MSGPTGRSEQLYCTNCGEAIKAGSQFCPECGEQQASMESEGRSNGAENQRTAQVRSSSRSRENIGFIFAFVDSWKRQKGLRHLLNIVLVFASFGTYLGVLLVEGLIHYHNLNTGKSEPYQEREDQKVWTTFTSLN